MNSDGPNSGDIDSGDIDLGGPGAAGHRMRIGDRGDLVAAVPYLLGFHPAESLVLVALRGTRLVVTARVDLPDPERAGELVARAAQILDTQRCDGVLLLAFSDDEDYPVGYLLARLAQALAGVVVDALVVRHAAWCSVFEPDGATEAVDAASPKVAEAVVAGLRALPSREGLADLARHGDDTLAESCTEAMLALIRSDPDDDELDARTAELLDAGLAGPLGEEAVAELAVLAGTGAGQAAALGRLTRDRASDLVGFWSSVVRRTPQPWAAGPLALLGMAAWVSGDGALQLICAERALAIDETEPLAHDLLDLNAAMVPPSAWDPARARGPLSVPDPDEPG